MTVRIITPENCVGIYPIYCGMYIHSILTRIRSLLNYFCCIYNADGTSEADLTRMITLRVGIDGSS